MVLFTKHKNYSNLLGDGFWIADCPKKESFCKMNTFIASLTQSSFTTQAWENDLNFNLKGRKKKHFFLFF